MQDKKEKIQLHINSTPPKERSNLHVAVGVYLIAWVFAFVWVFAAWEIWKESASFAAVILFADIIFIGILIHFSVQFKMKFNNRFVCEITDKAIYLFRYNPRKRVKELKKMQLEDIEKCEFYAYSDSGAIILTNEDRSKLEIPVWCFPDKGLKIMECLRKNNIEVFSVNM